MDSLIPACIACERNEHEVPLIKLQFQGNAYWICPEHFPILIHQPGKLAHKLPGLVNLKPGEH